MTGPSCVGERSHVLGPAATNRAAPDVTLERCQLRPQAAIQDHGWVQQPVDAECGSRQPRGLVKVKEGVDDRCRNVRLIAEDDNRALHLAPHCRNAGSQRSAHAQGVVRVEDDPGTAQVDRALDLRGVAPEDHDDLVEFRGADSRGDQGKQRLPLNKEQLLGSTHPARGAGGKDDPGRLHGLAGALAAIAAVGAGPCTGPERSDSASARLP